jgi:hypothetical protein
MQCWKLIKQRYLSIGKISIDPTSVEKNEDIFHKDRLPTS